jgi:hypothetical protein
MVFEDLRQTDEFGVPVNMFGPVPKTHYEAVGRVSMVASLLDTKMLHLLWALDDNTQDAFSDRYGNELEALVRAAASSVSNRLRKEVGRMLAEAQRLRGKRNGVIHSVWPNPADEQAFAWRPSAPAAHGLSPTKTFVTNHEEFMILIKDMIKMIDELARLTDSAQPEKADRMSRGRLHLLATERKCRVIGCTTQQEERVSTD